MRPETSLARLDNSSLADRVFEALVAAINVGDFSSGKLPSEPELAQLLGVSRTTVRSALASLELVGMVQRRPGAGTLLRRHVSADVLALHGLVPFSTLLGRNHAVTSTAELGDLKAWSDELEARLGRTPEGPVHEVKRVLYADGAPAVLIRELVPADVLARDLQSDDLDQSIISLSRRYFRSPTDHAIATLVPRAATKPVANLFGLKSGAAYLFLEETFYSAADEPLSLSDVSVNSTYIQLSVFRRVMA